MNFRTKNILLVIFSTLFGAGIFIWLGKIIGWEEIGESFKGFTIWQGALITFLSFLIAIIGNWRWQQILKDSDVNVPFWKLFRIYLGGYAMMYLVPIIIMSGEIFRVFGLSKESSVKVYKAASSVIIERILEWTVNLLVIFLGVFLLAYKLDILPNQILIVFGCALLAFIFALGFFYFKALRKKSIIDGFIKKFSKKEIVEGNSLIEIEKEVYKFFEPANPALRKGLALSLLRAIVMQSRVWILIYFLTTINTGIIESLSVLGFSYLSSMIPIPTSLGSHEVIQSAAFGSIGLAKGSATAFTMIIRAAEIIVSSVGLVFLIKKGFNVMEEKFNITTDEKKYAPDENK
jgi:uncharacterized protein (TIRG00374 family)